jgi:hypothetical protein
MQTSVLPGKELRAFYERASRFVEEHIEESSLAHDVEFEASNHLYRVWVQTGTVDEHVDELLALCDVQHDDGGWGDRRDDSKSRMRQTAFATQMLIRAWRARREERFLASIERGLDHIVVRQHGDGHWEDDRWHLLDATSVSVGTLIFAVNEPRTATDERRGALDRGMEFVYAQRFPDGLWYHKPKGSPVEITAHFLQKLVPYGSPKEMVGRAMEGVLERQHPDGHWDKQDVDSTCDAVRALMLGASTELGHDLRPDVEEASDRGLAWLLAAEQDGGFGSRPWHPPKVLYTCDVVDTALKYEIFHDDPDRLVTYYR